MMGHKMRNTLVVVMFPPNKSGHAAEGGPKSINRSVVITFCRPQAGSMFLGV